MNWGEHPTIDENVRALAQMRSSQILAGRGGDTVAFAAMIDREDARTLTDCLRGSAQPEAAHLLERVRCALDLGDASVAVPMTLAEAPHYIAMMPPSIAAVAERARRDAAQRHGRELRTDRTLGCSIYAGDESHAASWSQATCTASSASAMTTSVPRSAHCFTATDST